MSTSDWYFELSRCATKPGGDEWDEWYDLYVSVHDVDEHTALATVKALHPGWAISRYDNTPSGAEAPWWAREQGE